MNTQGVLAVGVPEAARRVGVSTRTMTTLVRDKQITSRKIGRRRVIPLAALEAFLRRDHELSTARHVAGDKRQ